MNLKHFIQDNQGRASHKAHAELRLQLVHDALDMTNGNKTEAARLLGISKTTLNTWLRDYS